jgi:hypothetical protein
MKPSIELIDKILLLTARSIGEVFLPVKGYFSSKNRVGDAVGQGMWIGGSHF